MDKLHGEASPPTKSKKVAALTASAGANSTAADTVSGNAQANDTPPDSPTPKTPRGRGGRKGSIAYVLYRSTTLY